MVMRNTRRTWIIVGLVGALALWAAGPAQAAEYTWGGGVGLWNSSNWLPGNVAGPTSSAHSAVINSGTVKLSGHDMFGNGGAATATTAITVNSGATLDTNGTTNPIVGLTLNGSTLLLTSGHSSTWGGLRLSGTLTAGGSAASTINTAGVAADREWIGVGNNTVKDLTIAVADATGNANADLTINANMIEGNWGANPHGVKKMGAGTLKLTGTNTYLGDTTIQEGTLDLMGSVTSAVTVKSGATLSGYGTITGNLAFESGANFAFNPTAPMTVSGSISFGGFGVSNITGLDAATLNTPYTLLSGAVTWANVSNVGIANAASIGGGRSAYFSEGSMVVTVIPEPATFGLFGVAAAAMWLRRRLAK